MDLIYNILNPRNVCKLANLERNPNCLCIYHLGFAQGGCGKARHANSLRAVNAVFCAPGFFSTAFGCAVKAGARLEINFRRIFNFLCVVVGDENIQ